MIRESQIIKTITLFPSGGWSNNLGKVEAFIALEISPGPHLVEESVREGHVFRNIVAWVRGPLELYDKKHVVRFWYGQVTSGDLKLRQLLVEKEEQIRILKEEKESMMEEHQKLSARLEEDVKCKQCFNVPTSAPLHSCSNGHITCSMCFKGPSSTCPDCKGKMGESTSQIGLTVIETIKRSCQESWLDLIEWI